MNKTRRSMPAQTRKKMNKAVRASAIQPEPILKSDRITPKTLLSRVPVKLQKEKKGILAAVEKTIKAKKVKLSVSKRTTPGTVNEKSAPQSVHIESGRWIKTLTKQTTAKRKVMTRQMTKKK